MAPSWRAHCPDSLARAPGVTGNSDGTWKVGLPVEEVPPELPEPALGINFARDGMAVRARTPRPPALLTAARRVNPRRHVVGRTTPRAVCAYRVAARRARKARQGTENGCTACGRSCGSARLCGAWHTSPVCPAARPPGGWLARPGCPVVVSLLLCLLTPGSPRQDKEAKDSGKPIRVVYYKWLELVAVHSDAWLMSVAFFFAAKAEKPDRSATFVLRPRPAPPLTPRHAWRRPD